MRLELTDTLVGNVTKCPGVCLQLISYCNNADQNGKSTVICTWATGWPHGWSCKPSLCGKQLNQLGVLLLLPGWDARRSIAVLPQCFCL